MDPRERDPVTDERGTRGANYLSPFSHPSEQTHALLWQVSHDCKRSFPSLSCA